MRAMLSLKKVILLFSILDFMFGCTALGPSSKPGDANEGEATYYSDRLHGRQTASGALYNKEAMTAAHRTLPFGTIVRVSNLINRRSVQVTINDRGPFRDRRRIIDLSRKAAERLDMIKAGVVPVRIEIVSLPSS